MRLDKHDVSSARWGTSLLWPLNMWGSSKLN